MTALMTGAYEMKNGAENEKGKFVNSEIRYKPSLSNIWDMIKEQFTTKRNAATPSDVIPLHTLSREQLEADKDDALYRLGHSTILMRLNGSYVLTDPVFSDRASPVQWAGPKRFHPAPIAIDGLPEIKAVIISHDHYDHLDKAAIKSLADKVEYFITPLKVGENLIAWGVDKSKIIELDWWQEVKVEGLTFVATPSQHFSGRGLFDRDETLWASWVIQSDKRNLFFSGDSGYFSGFKEIGDKYGPFDITMIETGAYNALWAEIHMLPEQSLQAHIDLRGKAMLPIHNGTFDLALHDWYEPFERITQLAQEKNVNLLTPLFGQPVEIEQPSAMYAWWREVEEKVLTKLAFEQ